MTRRFPTSAALLLAASFLFGAQEPIALIVNPGNALPQLALKDAQGIFMGTQKRFPSGLMALPMEQMQPARVRERFYSLLVGKDVREVNTHWARIFFSGQAQPPRQVQTLEEVLELVATNKGAIAFVELSKVTPRVKSVLVLGGP